MGPGAPYAPYSASEREMNQYKCRLTACVDTRVGAATLRLDRAKRPNEGESMRTRFAMSAFAPLLLAGMAYAGGSAPVDAGFTFDIPGGAGCDFPVNWTVTGKASLITLPGDRLIVTAPQQKAVVTNLDEPSKSVTLVVTSAFHVSTDANGDQIFTATGRSLLADPVANIMVLATGSFSWRFDPVNFALLDLSGTGKTVDVCAMIN